ncbi:hydrolase [Rheinheimera sp.]|uniref:hydrolase n=1 Tax=Rheinheimera sp. TaxID=1869214 RepID=UPI00307CDD3D
MLVRIVQYCWFRVSRLSWLSWLKLIPILFTLLLLISTFGSPVPDRQYHFPTAETVQSNFHVVEFNDEGEPHDMAQQEALFKRIAMPDSATAELVIFVHGWHQSAEPHDANFVSFKNYIAELQKVAPERNLIGLYLGWRGDKYDPLWLDESYRSEGWFEPLDFPTIFQRKRVSRKVGEVGVSRLLDRLDVVVEQGALKRYIFIGHSLGGSVAIHASKGRVKAAIDQGKQNPNLYLLLNPAITAKEYKPLDSLLSVDRQKPSMVVLQSKGDFAVKEAFNFLKDGERAVGNSWAITHDIDKCPRGNCEIQLNLNSQLAQHDAIPGCMMQLDRSGWRIRARVQARRGIDSCDDANMQAVWVLAVSDDIIFGHNGILTPDHAGALAEILRLIDRHNNQIPEAL